MTAETMARVLGGRKVGQGWTARCPAHDDREPSLSIRDAEGKLLVRCHAGCDQRDVIAALRERGLWDGKEPSTLGRSRRRKVLPPRPDPDQVERSAVALSIWQSAITADGTPVEAYLASRGLPCSPPQSLRFHCGLKHPSGGTWPCMVALVTRGADDAPLAIHRTFLAREGCGKAPVEPAKMMLGPCRGGAVHLGEPGEILMVGEGIETCLAAMQATGYPAWAALSTSGLRTLDLPGWIRDVIVMADGDDPGEAAARDCALRWMRQGRRIRIARPPRGLDFNDVLLGHAPGIEEGAQ
jgi:putative DNA primase/helicase